MSALETIASLLGIVNIVLLVRRSIWNYPFGLAMVVLYARVFFDARLYSDALLQIFFFVIQLYGWWAWWRAGGGHEPVAVRRLTPAARALWIAVIVVVTLAWGAIMHLYTDAAFPWWDGAVAVTSVAAQILLARRLIENWLLWIIVDLTAIALYVARGLDVTAGLYALFLLLSGWGLITWVRAERRGAA